MDPEKIETPSGTPHDSEVKIDCKVHGITTSTVEYKYNGKLIRRCCFLCYAEKSTDGLENFAPQESTNE